MKRSDLEAVPLQPGVYLLKNQDQKVIYVGKAKRLRKRLQQYFGGKPRDTKTQQLVSHVTSVSWVITRNDQEAFLLENQYIKRYRPKYNILLRDDKSYPYLVLTKHAFPRLLLRRGRPSSDEKWFGPYTSRHAASRALEELQTLFQLRSCTDREFHNRQRPCLQYQIKRCTAPCVGYMKSEGYDERVQDIITFLQGRNPELIESTLERMRQASQEQRFEEAAYYRDLLQQLRSIYQQQSVCHDEDNTDVLAVTQEGDLTVVVLLSLRDQEHMDLQHQVVEGTYSEPQDVLQQYLLAHYQAHAESSRRTKTLIVSESLEPGFQDALASILQYPLEVIQHPKGRRRRQLDMAMANANDLLAQHQRQASTLKRGFEGIQKLLELPGPPESIDAFDISHHMGEATYGVSVRHSTQGWDKSQYRAFKMSYRGDDVSAMRQAIARRYRKETPPDVVLIDGGLPQVHAAGEVLDELGLIPMALVGLSKGPSRRLIDETLILPDGRSLSCPPHHAGLQLLQRVRDEAHRFAIDKHRRQKQKRMKHSTLESIPGVGAEKAQRLLEHFGGLQALLRAGEEEIAQVPGIGLKLAQRVLANCRES